MRPFTVAYAALLAALIVIGAAGCPSTRPTGPSRPDRPTLPPTPGDPGGTAVPRDPPSVPGGEAPTSPGPALPPPPPPYPSPGNVPPGAPVASAPDVVVHLVSVSKDAATPVRIAGAWTLRALDGTAVAAGRALSADLALTQAAPRLGAWQFPGEGGVLEPADEGDLTIGKKRFPGDLRVSRHADGRWRATITTDLETYLDGVVAGELPPTFPRESMRAQAIIARTYVLSQADQAAQPGPRPLAVDDTGASDQEFVGIPADAKVRAKIRDAVASTRGLVLVSAGRPLRAWYHSTCGGQTCPAAVVFRSPPKIAAAARAAGLAGTVCGFCVESPKHRWKDAVIPGDAVVKAAGLKGALEAFAVGDTTLGGRATTFEVRAGGRTARVPAAEFRIAVGARALSSTWIDGVAVRGRDLVVAGRGWGHGVGLCQFGAKGMADRGHGGEAIVAHYYAGAELKRLW